MLFELLTGRQPYTGDTPLAVAYRHVNDVVPAPSSLVPGLPPALDSLVALATSKDPGRRPADAGQFLRAITGARHGLPLDVPPPAPYGALPGAMPGGATGAAPDASRADTTPPRAVVAPAWPEPAASGWPGTQPGEQPGAQSGPPSGGWPGMPPTGWPGPPQDGGGLDMIPGMPTQAVPSYGVAGTGQERLPEPYRPVTNQTLIVSASDAPYGAAPREPRLQRLLFSRRLAYLAAGLAVLLVFGLLGWWMFEGRYTIVPKVTGVSAATAKYDLRNEGLTPGTTTTVLDNGVAKGLVIRHQPGERIPDHPRRHGEPDRLGRPAHDHHAAGDRAAADRRAGGDQARGPDRRQGEDW